MCNGFKIVDRIIEIDNQSFIFLIRLSTLCFLVCFYTLCIFTVIEIGDQAIIPKIVITWSYVQVFETIEQVINTVDQVPEETLLLLQGKIHTTLLLNLSGIK